jgi:hypothetical protein
MMPPCIARRTALPAERKYFCTHPQVSAPHAIVTPGVCRGCPCVTTSSAQALRSFPPWSPRAWDLRRSRRLVVAADASDDVTWLKVFPDLEIEVRRLPPENTTARSAPAVAQLAHLVERYEELADVTIFMTGDPFARAPDLLERVWHLDDALAFQPLGDVVLAADASDGGPPSALARRHQELFGGSPPSYFAWHEGSCFAVAKERVRARPRAFYERALALAKADPDGAVAVGRLWREIFCGTTRLDGREVVGIVTAATPKYFRDLLLLLDSLRAVGAPEATVVNVGLTSGQAERLLHRPGVALKPAPALPREQAWTADEPRAAAWLKPLWLALAPCDKVLWLDADCVVLQPLAPLFDAVSRAPYFVIDPIQELVPNDPELYAHLSLPDGLRPSVYLNSGVVGLDRRRDWELLAAWLYGLQQVAEPQHRRSVRFEDQGLLNWSVYRLGLEGAIDPSIYWNTRPRQEDALLAPAAAKGISIWEHLRDLYSDAGLLHWMGNEKFFDQVADELACGFTLPLLEPDR